MVQRRSPEQADLLLVAEPRSACSAGLTAAPGSLLQHATLPGDATGAWQDEQDLTGALSR